MGSSVSSLTSWDQVRHVHVVGVCGTLMGAFAAFARGRGVRVTGSDQNVYPPMSDVLARAGVELFEGFRQENLSAFSQRPDVVVIGNVIRRDNPEASYAIENGYTYASLPEVMEAFFLGSTHNILACGTHGKTTTSSILAHSLVFLKQTPSYFIGGVSQDLPESFLIDPKGTCFVLEGDEYDTAFWDKVPKFNHYLPNDVILTSVEFDHADIYKDLNAVLVAFDGLIDRIRNPGRLIACMDYQNMHRYVDRARRRGTSVLTYGSRPECSDYWPDDMIFDANGVGFSVMSHAGKKDRIRLQLSGKFNVLNALAAWIELTQLGFSGEQVYLALESFRGVKRRMEVRGERKGVTVIDDFAHHPTAVRETLEGIRKKYPGCRLLTVFEPRSATSRRSVFQKEYSEAFSGSDLVWIAKPYNQESIDETQRFSSDQLVSDLGKRGISAFLFDTPDQGVERVVSEAQSGDVVAVLSNGGFGGFIPKLLDRLT